ncbi:MAG: putative Mitogen-activated protein kinase kinase, partial [Lacunisphaera sp.]|nr:putative Mitogen-activated protein kinase kinase [Lacunisphaera sp.]
RVACVTAAAILVSLVAALGISTWAYFNEKASRQFAVEAALAHKKASDGNRIILLRAADLQRRADAGEKQAAIDAAKSGYAMALMKGLTGAGLGGTAADVASLRRQFDQIANRLRADTTIPPEAKWTFGEFFGDLYMAQGDYLHAEMMFRDALTLRRERQGEGHPDLMPVWQKLIEALKKQGKESDARLMLRDAAHEQADFMRGKQWVRALLAAARDLQAHGRFVEAEAKLHEALVVGEANPYEGFDPIAIQGLIARLHFEAGDFSGARQLAEECILAEKTGRRWIEAGTFGFLTRTSDHLYLPPYDAHTVLGLIALREGNKAEARAQLLQSADGAPSRATLEAKDLELAAALAAAGEQTTVMKFIDRIRPRYVDLLAARNFENGIFALNDSIYYNAALAEEHAQTLSNWRMEMSAGKIPADWERPAGIGKNAAVVTATGPALLKKPSPSPSTARAGPWYPLLPFGFLMLGWCATAAAPRWSASRSLPKAATAWLLAFCVARTLDVALFTGTIGGNGFAPGFLVSLFLSFFSWLLLWEFLRALAPNDCWRWETRCMRAVWGFGLFEVTATQLAGYGNAYSVLMVTSLFGLVLLLLLTFALAFGVCIAAGRRIWRWQQTAGLSHGQKLSLKFAVPLLVVHGYVSLFAGVIHDNLSPSVAAAVFWISALLPWLLAVGFLNREPAGEPITA